MIMLLRLNINKKSCKQMIKDDYNAKYKIGTKENKVWAMPKMIEIKKVKSEK